MKQQDFYKNISKKYSYKNIPNWFILKPLIIWANTNAMLDDFYARPEINLAYSELDNEIRNIMRHTTGLGLTATQYGYFAYILGAIKEFLDILKDVCLHKPYGKVSKKVIEDTITDFKNNHKGIQYMLNNPNATSEDLMNYAYQLATEQLNIKKARGKNTNFSKKRNTSNKNLYDYDKNLINKDILLNNNKSDVVNSDGYTNLQEIVIPLPKEENNYYVEESDNELKEEIFVESSKRYSEDNTNSTDERNGNKPLEGRVEENIYKDSTDKSDDIPTGYAANITPDDTERELLKQLRENSRADIGIADKIRNEGKILEKLINNQAQNDSQSTKPSTKEELEKDELYQRIKKERGQVKVINSNEFSWEQIIKDTLAFPNAMRDFCYPSEKSPFGKSGEIFTNTDIKKNEYYTPPQPKENRKSTHGRYLNPAHEEEIERVVSSIFDSVAREMGY